MKKQYTAPQMVVFESRPVAIMAGSPPKMDGSVIDGDGNTVDGTDWGYGGDGSETDTPEAKPFTPWDMWED